MSSIMKVFLLLAVLVCISTAQLTSPQNEAGQQCLCRRVSGLRSGMRSNIKDLQIYSATSFCNRVEIVVTTKTGHHFCLNPELADVQRLMANIMRKQKSITATPASSLPGQAAPTQLTSDYPDP